MQNFKKKGEKWDKAKMICATGSDPEKNQVTCFGDSGGPVLELREHRWTLVGIISFGNDIRDSDTQSKRCDASMPFYFVNVEEYSDWINAKLN